MGAKTFTAVGFAPLYDAVTTRVFPGLGGDRMALKLDGKDDRLTRQDFLSLARTIGLTVEEAEAGLGALATRITERLTSLQLPAFASEFDGARPSVTRRRRRFVPESSRGPPERGADMRGRVVVVNDKMQQGYWYNLTAPVGRDFDPEFRSDLTPAQMLELGVFGRKYMTDTQGEFPAEWFERAETLPGAAGLFAQILPGRREPATRRLAREGLDRSSWFVPMVLPLSHGTADAGGRLAPDRPLEGDPAAHRADSAKLRAG